jgi:hypothetical protein
MTIYKFKIHYGSGKKKNKKKGKVLKQKQEQKQDILDEIKKEINELILLYTKDEIDKTIKIQEGFKEGKKDELSKEKIEKKIEFLKKLKENDFDNLKNNLKKNEETDKTYSYLLKFINNNKKINFLHNIKKKDDSEIIEWFQTLKLDPNKIKDKYILENLEKELDDEEEKERVFVKEIKKYIKCKKNKISTEKEEIQIEKKPDKEIKDENLNEIKELIEKLTIEKIKSVGIFIPTPKKKEYLDFIKNFDKNFKDKIELNEYLKKNKINIEGLNLTDKLSIESKQIDSNVVEKKENKIDKKEIQNEFDALEKLEKMSDLQEIKQELETNNNKIYTEIKDYITDYEYNPKDIIINLKKFFDNKLKQFNNESTKFTNKIINYKNEIDIKKYQFLEKYNDYDIKWTNYFKNTLCNNKYIYLNFNLLKFIKDIFDEEIDYGKPINYIYKINNSNYYAIYQLIIKLINIKNLKNINIINLFFSDYDMNSIIEFIFNEKMDNLSEDDIYYMFKIFNELRFKINVKNFNSLISFINNNETTNNDETINDDETVIINNKITNYKKLLYLFFFNKSELQNVDINFIKDYVIDLYNDQDKKDDYIIFEKNSTDKFNTSLKFNLYNIFSVLYVLDLLNDDEINFIKRVILAQINIVSSDNYEFQKASEDEKLLKQLFKNKKKFKTEYIDTYHIIPFDFYFENGVDKILVELDGKFHFTININEDGSLTNKYHIKDFIKNELANKLGYKLIRLSFMYNIEEMENLYHIDYNGFFIKKSSKDIRIFLKDKDELNNYIFDENYNIMNANLNYKLVYQIKNSIKSLKYFKLKEEELSKILDN